MPTIHAAFFALDTMILAMTMAGVCNVEKPACRGSGGASKSIDARRQRLRELVDGPDYVYRGDSRRMLSVAPRANELRRPAAAPRRQGPRSKVACLPARSGAGRRSVV